MLKRRVSTALIILMLAGAAATSIIYFKFVSNKIYEESSAHLTEIYNQINSSFYELVSKNWKNLKSWIPYFDDVSDDGRISEFIEEQQKLWGFTDFYFISYDGFYKTDSGSFGYIDMNDQLPKLILDKEPVVIDGIIKGNTELTFFAVPASGNFRGFAYEAIAISYDNRDMRSALEISVFDGQLENYVLYPNGRVFIDNAGNSNRSTFNFLSWLDYESDMSDDEIAKLRNDFQNGEFGITTFRSKRRLYYIIYEPVNFRGWMVIGVVPAKVVNASMNQLQAVTILVFISIVSAFVTVILWLISRLHRQKLAKKDTEIKYREELFSTLTNNVNDVFIMMDAKQFRVVYVSPNADKLLGVSAEEIKANVHSLDRLLHISEPINVLDLLPDLMPGEKKEWEREYIHSKTGDNRFFHALAYYTEIDGIGKYVLVLSDRTEDRVMNQALKNALDIAESANKAKSNFLANMSHDIRTPMNAIMGFSTLLGKNADRADKVREYAGKIEFSGRHLLGIINDILDMSKIESGHTSLNITTFSPAEMMTEVYSIVLPQTKIKGQSLEFCTKGSLPPYVLGDKVRLNQILLNLLSNAVKYTPDGGRISLTLEALEQDNPDYTHMCFIVEDTGCGMSEEFINKIFDPFARESNEVTDKIQGTGLGMAITKNLVDLMGGAISIQSSPWKGSIFTVNLELKNADENTEGQLSASHRSYESPGKISLDCLNILVCEDNETNAEIIKELLAAEGAGCEIASNGREAFECFLNSSPGTFDFIFMDIQMPVMDGYEATRLIRGCSHPEAKTVPIIAMTAHAYEEDIRRTREAGMNAHAVKPIDMNNLILIISKLMNK